MNINTILYQILAAMTTSYGDKWDLVKTTAEEYLTASRERLSNLAIQRLENQIDNDFLVERMKDELKILETELLSYAVIAEGVAQDAVNNAVDAFQNAINALIPKK